MCEKLSVRKDNSKKMCISTNKHLKINSWYPVTEDDLLFTMDGSYSELISVDDLRNCYLGLYNSEGGFFLPGSDITKYKEVVEDVFNGGEYKYMRKLAESKSKGYLISERLLETNQVYMLDHNKDIAVYYNILEVGNHYKKLRKNNVDITKIYLYSADIAGNCARPITLIGDRLLGQISDYDWNLFMK